MLPEMFHCSNSNNSFSTDMSVLERQRACLQWQQQQQEESCFSYGFGGLVLQGGGGLSEVVAKSLKPDPGFVDNYWTDFVGFGPCFDMNDSISRTSGCPPSVAAAAAEVAEAAKGAGGEFVVPEKISSSGVAARENFKKRNVGKVNVEENIKDKKLKASVEVNDTKTKSKNNNKSSNSNKESSGDTSKDNNSKVTEAQKPDYIHVRARRGQATDSHSLAERVRREKISERMKFLQTLVPGCNKITGKAGMLDEIINYVQSLQRQVEFLSMKLAAVNPQLNFNVDNLFAKENGMSSDMTSPSLVQFNPMHQQIAACSGGLNMGINSPDMGLKRMISAPNSIPETFFDSTCFNHSQATSNWDVDLINLCNVGFDQGRSTSFPSQSFTDSLEIRNLKMEM